MFFPGVLHIFVECGQHLLGTSEPQLVPMYQNLLFSQHIYFIQVAAFIMSCLLLLPTLSTFQVVWHRFRKLSCKPHSAYHKVPQVRR
jgi:hypothetical protein